VAELRSFVVGVIVAGGLLVVVALALGAFSGEGEEAPTARLLGTPPASATARATQRPATTALPTIAATRQPSPAASASATTGPATSPTSQATAAPSATTAPQPTANPVTAYVSTVSVLVTDLGAQIDYLVGAGSSNPSGSTQAAGTVKALAGRIQGLAAPSCMSNPHGTLLQGAGSANTGADQLIAALGASNQGAVNTALSTLSSAKGTLGQGAAAVSSTSC
jgi:hypothetical protein